MSVIDGRMWMEHLSEQECWELLASVPVGRIGVLVDSAPEIYPITHAVDGASIVFRTDSGNKLRAIDRSPSVCFEVDGPGEPGPAGGWSVLLKGRAVELGPDDERPPVDTLPLGFWGTGDKSHWIRITPYETTGRRLVSATRRSS